MQLATVLDPHWDEIRQVEVNLEQIRDRHAAGYAGEAKAAIRLMLEGHPRATENQKMKIEGAIEIRALVMTAIFDRLLLEAGNRPRLEDVPLGSLGQVPEDRRMLSWLSEEDGRNAIMEVQLDVARPAADAFISARPDVAELVAQTDYCRRMEPAIPEQPIRIRQCLIDYIGAKRLRLPEWEYLE